VNAPGSDFDANESPIDVPATIFVSDPSVEADRLSTSLRSRGYTVIDVPLSLLLARVAVQIPSIILLDVEADGALEIAVRLREIPGGQSVDVLFLGDAPAPLGEQATSDASGFLVRPVNVAALLDRVDALVRARREVGPISGPESGGPSTPGGRSLSARPSGPPTPRLSGVPPSRGAVGGPPSSPRRPALVEPRRSIAPAVPAVEERLAAGLSASEGSALPLPSLSPEIEGLLRAAEDRSKQEPGSSGRRGAPAPSPEDEVDAVLPAELLEALDEPLDESEDFDGDSALTTGLARRPVSQHATPPLASAATEPPSSAEPTSTEAPAHGADGPGNGFLPPSAPPVSPPAETTALEDPKQLDTPRPPRAKPRDRETVPPPFWRSSRSQSRAPASERPARRAQSSIPERGVSRDELAKPSDAPPDAAPLELPDVVGPGAALHAFATCVRSRSTGALCIEVPEGIRRILLRDGDVVTAASGLDDESLVAFLESRGDLAHDVAAQLRGRVPAFGRHAGAALVANGQISQDQLWPVLRAHAEWILGRTISIETGTASFEVSPPPRLKTEPSVFGGATGAEVLIEVVRRTVPATDALHRLGSEGARIIDGSRRDLLAECALHATEIDALDRLKGATLAELLDAPDHLAPTVYALVELSVLDIDKEKERSEGFRSAPGALAPGPLASARASSGRPRSAHGLDRWDEGALRAQVKTRLSLVKEADYFTLLGVPSTATAYEIHRAYLELRRTLEPTRVLSAATADLTDDLLLIIDVLEEAHDVLRDQVRRERYRRAIEAKPPS
jgi:hypothetical protein